MEYVQERGSTHVYRVNKISKEEMDAMVALCTYEQPPFCNAACPLRLDAKAMLSSAANGDFKKALQVYEKAAIFPLIISAGCEAPCEKKCRLCEVGEGVSIRAVEAAVARFGERSKSSGVFRSKKKKTVAIFGSGLFALFLAGELEKKSYPLTVFCEEPDARAYLKNGTDFLGGEDFEAELKRLCAMDIEFEYNCAVTAELLREKRQGFDVVCASEMMAKRAYPEARCDEALMIYRPERLVMGAGSGVLETAFNAKKAALTVDRLAQNLDPDNTRGEEGSRESRLYTDLTAATALRRVPAGPSGYTREQAEEESKRCIQCLCQECFKGCAYLRHYKKYPALISREIYNNTQIIMGDHQLNKPMNSCALCGQCTVTCPNGFDMARVCHLARQNMVSTDKMPNSPHEFALLDMIFSNEDAFLARPQPGFDKCRYVFFPGCQASAIAPGTVRAAYEDLRGRLPGGVALMLGCCGAICDWAGRYEMYDSTREFIRDELKKLGDPIVIAGCPTCMKELREHEGIEVMGIWDALEELGLPESAHGLDRPAALHDPCGARGDAHTQQAIRSIAGKLGCTLVDTPYSGDRSPCCGYGGLTAYSNREVARELTEECLKRSDAAYISYCMACRDRFAREGRESKHILELVYGTDAGAPPDISEKRFNRLNLKNTLLRELWGEEAEEKKLDYKLSFTNEALRMMDERMILKSDVIGVLEEYRESGEAVEDTESGLLVARSRIGNATFWIAFTEDGGGYTVHRAYSHRMKITRRK